MMKHMESSSSSIHRRHVTVLSFLDTDGLQMMTPRKLLAVTDSRDSSVGTATGYEVQFPARARDVSLLHSVQTGSGAHPASTPMDIWGSFTEDIAARA
jgi:hypothetical protein